MKWSPFLREGGVDFDIMSHGLGSDRNDDIRNGQRLGRMGAPQENEGYLQGRFRQCQDNP